MTLISFCLHLKPKTRNVSKSFKIMEVLILSCNKFMEQGKILTHQKEETDLCFSTVDHRNEQMFQSKIQKQQSIIPISRQVHWQPSFKIGTQRKY